MTLHLIPQFLQRPLSASRVDIQIVRTGRGTAAMGPEGDGRVELDVGSNLLIDAAKARLEA